jgi:hypothetical protein
LGHMAKFSGHACPGPWLALLVFTSRDRTFPGVLLSVFLGWY